MDWFLYDREAVNYCHKKLHHRCLTFDRTLNTPLLHMFNLSGVSFSQSVIKKKLLNFLRSLVVRIMHPINMNLKVPIKQLFQDQLKMNKLINFFRTVS